MRLLFLSVVLMLSACDGSEGALDKNDTTNQLPETLVVVTRNAPTTYYEERDEIAGMEFDLINAFARHNNIKVKFEVVHSIGEVLERLKDNKAHIAAAGLTRTDERLQQGYEFGPEYFQVQQQVVCRRDNGAIPKSAHDLVGKKIEVIADSSYVERLKELQQEIPPLKWTEVEDMGTEQLLEKVWLKEVDCTVADSNIVSINRRYYPELVVAFPLSEDQSLAWILTSDWAHLRSHIESWLQQAEQNGDIATINERYYGHVDLFDYVDMKKFIGRIKTRLPKYKDTIKKASSEHVIDWTLIAAQAYQESHWNPKSRSPTGVRGLMMLTQLTAKAMGVTNRLDAAQSIRGGVKYLAKMFDRLPHQIQGENRAWMALAAYNVGYGHLKDARKLAITLGKDPNSWAELKQVFPLLAQKKYYKQLQYGYARGSEPVSYVQRIRDYQQVLLQNLK